MSTFKEIRHVVEAGRDAGLDSSSRRNLAEGTVFSKAEIGLLGELKESLRNTAGRQRLLDILESKNQPPLPLSELLGTIEKIGNIRDRVRGKITEQDLQVLSFAVKYFENWFYRGEWANLPAEKIRQPQAYAYLSVPAGIVNFLTKIKEIDEYSAKFADFDSTKLDSFVGEVRKFAFENLGGIKLLETRKKDKADVEKLQAWTTFDVARKSVEYEFTRRDLSKENGGQPGANLYLVKTCIIVAEMQRRADLKANRHIFIPDSEMPTGPIRFKRFDFNPEPNRSSIDTMHVSTSRLPFAKFAVEYLRQKNQK